MITVDVGRLPAVALDPVDVVLGGEPVVVRTGSGVAAEVATAAADVLRRLPTVTVVEGRPAEVPPVLAAAADVCLTDVTDPPRPWVTSSVAEVEAAVAAQPGAATALVVLLRAAEALDPWAAIAAEAATYGMLLSSSDHRAWLEARPPRRPRPSPAAPVRVDRRGATLEVELDRPGVRNAIDSATRDALVEALEVAAADPSVEAVELSGAGPCFSAGGDLAEFGTVPDGATAFAVRLARHPGWAVHRVADRVTARVHGPCVGAGVEVPAFASVVTAAPDATFRLPELEMGLVPGAGGTVSISRRTGRHRTAWLALTGREVSATTALLWGLVDAVR